MPNIPIDKLGNLLSDCPYCGRVVVLVMDSSVIYSRDYGPIWACWSCNAWVGTHKGSSPPRPFGTVANAKDRVKRRKCHVLFDSLWKRKIVKERCSTKKARAAAYKWLAGELGKPVHETHIGQMHGEDLDRVIDVCTPHCRLHDIQVAKSIS